MFKITEVDLGTVHANKEYTVEFPYTEDTVISSMVSPCGCSIPTDMRTEKKVVIKYTPAQVPVHLVPIGYYTSHKIIQVTYTDNTGPGLTRQQALIIIAKVV